MGGASAGPGSGQLVQQRTEELSAAVKEKWGQALGGIGAFGNRTKEVAESARTQIGAVLILDQIASTDCSDPLPHSMASPLRFGV